MPVLVAVADYNIAYLYYLRGEYTRSIELYRAAREHCHELGDTYREGLCDLDQSEMYLELNLSEEGAHLARRALDGLPRSSAWGTKRPKPRPTWPSPAATTATAGWPSSSSARRGELFTGKQPRLDRHHRSLPGPGAPSGGAPCRGA